MSCHGRDRGGGERAGEREGSPEEINAGEGGEREGARWGAEENGNGDGTRQNEGKN